MSEWPPNDWRDILDPFPDGANRTVIKTRIEAAVAEHLAAADRDEAVHRLSEPKPKTSRNGALKKIRQAVLDYSNLLPTDPLIIAMVQDFEALGKRFTAQDQRAVMYLRRSRKDRLFARLARIWTDAGGRMPKSPESDFV